MALTTAGITPGWGATAKSHGARKTPARAVAKRTVAKTSRSKVRVAATRKAGQRRGVAASSRRVATRRTAIRKGYRRGRYKLSHYVLTRHNVNAEPALNELPPMVSPLADLSPSELRDTFFDARVGRRVHHAIDIFRPTGTPLYAVVDGVIEKTMYSGAGGKSIYLYDESRAFCFYYAHLDKYAEGIVPGAQVKRGDLIGYVGTTGNARRSGAHLHFQIMRSSTPEQNWWTGAGVLNPYPVLMELIAPPVVDPTPITEEVTSDAGGDRY